MSPEQIDALAWQKMDSMLPAIVQDRRSGRVLMLGYMNRAALETSLADGWVTFHSRSKGRLWRKGETSGNRLRLIEARADCDADALLILAEPEGPTCHEGTRSCFGESDGAFAGLADLGETVSRRARFAGAESYTRRLLDAGPARIAQKIGEEGVEVALAAVTRDAQGCGEEIADLLYHLTVLLEAKGLDWSEVMAELRRRRG